MTVPGDNRYVCIHAHLYQPPRENPWLDVIEEQATAAPYHDWNERVAAECYAPNARARLLDEQRRITALVNNYEHVSFNVGPTLMSWLAAADADTYDAIRRADRESTRRYGYGNAIAQAYGHAILPLADARDRATHVRWGIREFVHRFGRAPVGMWLPETAVDSATLRLLAEHGIRFTILAPHQAARVRRAGATGWETLLPRGIDPRRAYRWRSGRAELAVFFYDHDLAHGVAFGGLLNDGPALVERLRAGFAPASDAPQLVHLATDGESYGHHHRFGEMALAYAVDRLTAAPPPRLTNYAAFLQLAPPRDEVEIVENSSWSCTHGIERWRADCGCNSGAHPEWHQQWRQPLRTALTWLKGEVDRLFGHAMPLLREPWAARDAYIDVVLDPSREQRETFLAAQARANLSAAERVHVWKLLEMQRAALLMFTSCGWFFDDLAGIETVQVLRYAGRAIQLATELGTPLEADFLVRLEAARSNIPEHPSGRQLYRTVVLPAAVTPARAAAHAVMTSLFDAHGELPARAYTYRFDDIERVRHGAGRTVLAMGGMQVSAEATEEETRFAYAALYLGGHDVHCAIGGDDVLDRFPMVQRRLAEIFAREPLSAAVRAIDAAFGVDGFTLRDLFHAERRAILHGIAAEAVAPCLAELSGIFDQHRRMLDFLHDAQVSIPDPLREVTRVVLGERLAAALGRLAGDATALDVVRTLVRDARRWGVTLPAARVRTLIEHALPDALAGLATQPGAAVALAEALLEAAAMLEVTLNLWAAQNTFYGFVTSPASATLAPDAAAAVRRLGERLGFATGRTSQTIAAVA